MELDAQLNAVNSPLTNQGALAVPTGNRFVPGGYITGPNANQRFYTQVVSSNTLGSSPIQQAINEADRVGGGKVFIKSGTYTMGTNINLTSNIDLVGEDAKTTVLDFNLGINSITTSGSNIVLSNLT